MIFHPLILITSQVHTINIIFCFLFHWFIHRNVNKLHSTVLLYHLWPSSSLLLKYPCGLYLWHAFFVFNDSFVWIFSLLIRKAILGFFRALHTEREKNVVRNQFSTNKNGWKRVISFSLFSSSLLLRVKQHRQLKKIIISAYFFLF